MFLLKDMDIFLKVADFLYHLDLCLRWLLCWLLLLVCWKWAGKGLFGGFDFDLWGILWILWILVGIIFQTVILLICRCSNVYLISVHIYCKNIDDLHFFVKQFLVIFSQIKWLFLLFQIFKFLGHLQVTILQTVYLLI